jgi:AraC-like DNA-binding protein
LSTENCRFKELVNFRSKAVAERLLRDSNISVGDISMRLGFTDPAAFCRAFRRWFKTTPRDYRQQFR